MMALDPWEPFKAVSVLLTLFFSGGTSRITHEQGQSSTVMQPPRTVRMEVIGLEQRTGRLPKHMPYYYPQEYMPQFLLIQHDLPLLF
jgi:hypothetical protein